MERKPLAVDEEHQNIRENNLIEDYDFDPKQPRRYYVNNLFQRVFSHLIGWSTLGARKLRCTVGGILQVAPIGTGYEHNDTYSGNAPDTYGAAIVFDRVVSRIDIMIWDNDAVIKRSLDGVTYDDEMEIPSNYAMSFDCSTYSILVKNKTAGQKARYQITGWY